MLNYDRLSRTGNVIKLRNIHTKTEDKRL